MLCVGNFCLKDEVMTGHTVLQRCGSHHCKSNDVSLSLTGDDWIQSTSFLSYGKLELFISLGVVFCFVGVF